MRILCNDGHVRIHIRTAKNTTLHHPSMHSDNDTDRKNNKTRQIPYTSWISLAMLYPLSRVCGCALLNLCWSTREWVVAALGRRWTWRHWTATCRWASRRWHRQGPWVAKQRCSSTCSGPQARRSSSTLCRWCCKAFDARALGRGPRGHRGETWKSFSENCSNSLPFDSDLQSTGSPLSARVGDPYRSPSAGPSHPVILPSGRRISEKTATSRRLDLDVICLSDEKIFKVDAAVPIHGFFHALLGENWADVTMRPLLFGIHHTKTGGCIVTSALF